MGFQQVFYLEYAAVDKVTPVSNKVTNKVTANNKKISGSFASMSASSMKSLRQLNSVFNLTANAAVASSVAIVGFMTKSTAETAMMIDSFKNQMLVYTGSVEGANKEWEKAKDMADRTGMSLRAVAGTYGKFAVAAKSAGLEQKLLTGIYEEFGKASVAMGLSQENVKLSLKAIEQMFSKGTVAAEELKSQLGEHFPDAMGVAARSMGLTTGELMKFMKEGKVLASELLPKMAKMMRQELGAASKQAMGQLRKSLNQLDNSFIKLKETLITAGFVDLIKGTVDGSITAIEELRKFLIDKFFPTMDKLAVYLKSKFSFKPVEYNNIKAAESTVDKLTRSLERLEKQLKSAEANRVVISGDKQLERNQELIDSLTLSIYDLQQQIMELNATPVSIKKEDEGVFGGIKTGESSLSRGETSTTGGELKPEEQGKSVFDAKTDPLGPNIRNTFAEMYNAQLEEEAKRLQMRKELEEQKQQEINDIIAGKMNERLGIQEHGFGAITNLVAKSGSEQAGLMASAFGSMIASSASFSKKAFKLQQGLAIANAVVKGYEAVQGAYAFGNNIGGPPLGAAMAAAALVNTVSRIRAIKSQSFGGSSTVSSGSTSSASASTSGVASNNNATLNTATGEVTPTSDQVVKIELQGEVFNKEQVRELISSINDVLDEGYTLRV